MDNRTEVRDFLTSRRERLTPEQAGVPSYGGGRRRVKGLRREEVAMLAGMSTDYYTRLERGNLTGVSDSVLESLARTLQFDEAERAHLFDLAAASTASGQARNQAADPGRSSGRTVLRPGVHRILDSLNAPAYVSNARMDILATNQLGRALFTDAYGDQTSGLNLARYLFLDPRSRDFYLEWDTVARDAVASLRINAGHNPHDRGLSDLVGELTTRSQEFSTWWATHMVKFHRSSTKRLNHSVVGELQVTGEALELTGDPGLRIIAYTVEPASPSEQALAFLASWSTQTTSEHQEPTRRQ
jgi:transcriptional regulator with XRE-family HTH domain